MSALENNHWQIVPATKIYEIFHKVVKLPEFEVVGRNLLAKQVSTDLVHLVNLAAYKGALYGLRWGVSLSYVPHRWEKELRWHRSLKSARLDLFDEPMDLPPTLNLAKQPLDQFAPCALHGPEAFERDLTREWQILHNTITSWFERVADLHGILAMSEEQMERSWTGPHHWPPPSLIHSFTLARMGNLERATKELQNITDTGVHETKFPPPEGSGEGVILICRLERPMVSLHRAA